MKATLAFLALLSLPAAIPSDPVGVYALIDRVELLPNPEAPTRARIHGAFAVAVGMGDFHTTPARGSLLFDPGEDAEECVKQWRELQTLAGSGQVIGFSSRHGQKDVKLQPSDGTRAEPGTYSTWMGLQKIDGVDYGPVRALRLLPAPLSPVPGAAPKAHAGPRRTPRTLTFTTTNCVDTPAGAGYVFSVSTSGGEHVASAPIPPGKGTTSWTTELSLLSGDVVTWSVHVSAVGVEKAPVASVSFTVGAEQGAEGRGRR